MSALNAYLDAIDALVARIRERQTEAIQRAADLCADLIAKDGLIHLFGSDHSRILVEETYPRYGSFPGFHPIVELSVTHHTQVVGANNTTGVWVTLGIGVPYSTGGPRPGA
jgi:uncharacterized phosphosugar-binding protein